MTAFDHDDTHEAAEMRVPDGMIDVTYALLIESALIDELDRNVTDGVESARWMSADPSEIPALCGITDPRGSEDEKYALLAICSLTITSTLIGLIHEESSTGMLKHLARLNDTLDEVEDSAPTIDRWYVLSQLVYLCNPLHPSGYEGATDRILALIYDDDGSVNEKLALHLTKYLLWVSLAIIHGDDPDLRRYLVDQLRADFQERAVETSIPYFETDDGDVEYC